MIDLCGEMELTAYLARSANDFIDQARGDTAKIDNQLFLNNLLGLGLTKYSPIKTYLIAGK